MRVRRRSPADRRRVEREMLRILADHIHHRPARGGLTDQRPAVGIGLDPLRREIPAIDAVPVEIRRHMQPQRRAVDHHADRVNLAVVPLAVRAQIIERLADAPRVEHVAVVIVIVAVGQSQRRRITDRVGGERQRKAERPPAEQPQCQQRRERPRGGPPPAPGQRLPGDRHSAPKQHRQRGRADHQIARLDHHGNHDQRPPQQQQPRQRHADRTRPAPQRQQHQPGQDQRHRDRDQVFQALPKVVQFVGQGRDTGRLVHQVPVEQDRFIPGQNARQRQRQHDAPHLQKAERRRAPRPPIAPPQPPDGIPP
mgnify:CR=1 FL=1